MGSLKTNISVLFIDDDPAVLSSAAQTLELSGLSVSTFDRAKPALEIIATDLPSIVVVDVRMPEMDGLEFLEKAIALDPELPIIMLTGHGDVDMAVRAMRIGAWDFLQRPVHPRQLVDCADRAIKHRSVILENREYQKASLDIDGISQRLLGDSESIRSLRETVAALANADANILIRGETGSGKEEVARCLHDFGPRKDKNFVAINCGAVPENMIESELFGHEKGAFTGAQSRRIGKLQHADGGTVFLDEIESMPLDMQVRLLRVLQDRVVEPIGGNRSIPLDIRIIAASKGDLYERALQGQFRDDLYYRLHVAEIFVPPVRERQDDILILFKAFLERAAVRLDKAVPLITPELEQELLVHNWPGNVREIVSAAERHLLDLPIKGQRTSSPLPTHQQFSLQQKLDTYEKSLILKSLADNNGSMQHTADDLQLPYKTLYLRLRKYGIDKKTGKE
ncbi:MAG: sigma-54-dependent Fis family transcriptional regulator [Sneathiella sp.]|nr:sigma-54-dependent Fis family transcriptional regulator [Sneathiella sp.]